LKKYIILFLIFRTLPASAQLAGNTADTIPTFGFSNTKLSTGSISGFIDSTGMNDLIKIQHCPFNIPYATIKREIAKQPLHRDFWLKGTIRNQSDDTIHSYFFCGLLNYVYLYFISPHHPTQTVATGDLLNANKKNRPFVQQVAQVLPLVILPHQSGTVFIKIRQRTPYPRFEGLQIHSAASMYERVTNFYFVHRYEGLFALFFMGFMICQMLYVFFQWLLNKGREYLYYTLYLLTLMLYFLNKDEIFIGTDILFIRYPVLGVYFDKTLLLLPYFLYYRFVRSFLNIPRDFKAINKWIIGLEYVILAYLVFDLIFVYTTFDLELQLNIFTIFIGMVFLLTLCFIYYLFLKRKRLIYYILLGSLCVGLGNILGLLSTYLRNNLHIFIGPENDLLYAQFGVIIEIICFTAGLSYKSRLSEKEKIKSQQMLINQLEENEILQLKMQNIRSEISRDLHDDVGATLSTILLYSNAAKQKRTAPNLQETQQAINKIGEIASRMIDNMGDMVWAVNPHNDNMGKIFN